MLNHSAGTRVFFLRRLSKLGTDFKPLYPVLNQYISQCRVIGENDDVMSFAKGNPDYTGLLLSHNKGLEGKGACSAFVDQGKIYLGAITNILKPGGAANGLIESADPLAQFNAILAELEELEVWLFNNRINGISVQSEPIEYRVQKIFVKQTPEDAFFSSNWDNIKEELLVSAEQWINLQGETAIHNVVFGSGMGNEGKNEAYVLMDLSIAHYPREESRIEIHEKAIRQIAPFSNYTTSINCASGRWNNP